MAFGLGVLGLAPAQFWAMTPVELACAITGATGGISAPRPLDRGDLAALIARYPDLAAPAPAPDDGRAAPPVTGARE